MVPTNEIQPIGSLFSIPIPIPIPTPIRNKTTTDVGRPLSSSGSELSPSGRGRGRYRDRDRDPFAPSVVPTRAKSANRIPILDSDSDSDTDADQKRDDDRCWRALVVFGLGIVPIRSGSASLSGSGSRSFSRHPWFPRAKSSQSDPYFRFRFRFRYRRRSETKRPPMLASSCRLPVSELSPSGRGRGRYRDRDRDPFRAIRGSRERNPANRIPIFDSDSIRNQKRDKREANGVVSTALTSFAESRDKALALRDHRAAPPSKGRISEVQPIVLPQLPHRAQIPLPIRVAQKQRFSSMPPPIPDVIPRPLHPLATLPFLQHQSGTLFCRLLPRPHCFPLLSQEKISWPARAPSGKWGHGIGRRSKPRPTSIAGVCARDIALSENVGRNRL